MSSEQRKGNTKKSVNLYVSARKGCNKQASKQTKIAGKEGRKKGRH